MMKWLLSRWIDKFEPCMNLSIHTAPDVRPLP
jgi:hypothetical protein